MWQMCQQNNQLYERLCVLRAYVVVKALRNMFMQEQLFNLVITHA